VGFYPQGNSMHPTIVPGRDSVIVEPLGERKIKRGDVILFRRSQDAPLYPGMLVIHRVCRVKKDGVYMVGDNEVKVEGPLERDQLLGIMTELHRKKKIIRTTAIGYRMLTGIWLFLRPVRFIVAKPVVLVKRIFKKKSRA
jgi:hypothetical protein